MRIQWNSGAAQEMLDRLAKADQALEDCMRQSASVRSALSDANVEGDDRALQKISERFERCTQTLRAFIDSLGAFERAVRKADAQFEEAESELARLADTLTTAGGAPNSAGESSDRSGGWGAAAYAVMPDMRVHVAPMPSWLESVTMESQSDI